MDMCTHRRFKSVCAFAQFDQDLHWTHFWIAKVAKFLYADNKDSDQTARIRVFVRRTSAGTFSDVAAHMYTSEV